MEKHLINIFLLLFLFLMPGFSQTMSKKKWIASDTPGNEAMMGKAGGLKKNPDVWELKKKGV